MSTCSYENADPPDIDSQSLDEKAVVGKNMKKPWKKRGISVRFVRC